MARIKYCPEPDESAHVVLKERGRPLNTYPTPSARLTLQSSEEPEELNREPLKRRGRPSKDRSLFSAAYERRVSIANINVTGQEQDHILETRTLPQGGDASNASEGLPVPLKRRKKIRNYSENRHDAHKKHRTASVEATGESNLTSEISYGTRSKSRTNSGDDSGRVNRNKYEGTLISGDLAEIANADSLVFPVQIVSTS